MRVQAGDRERNLPVFFVVLGGKAEDEKMGKMGLATMGFMI